MRLPFALTLTFPLLRNGLGPRHRLQLNQGCGAVRGVIVHCTRKVVDTPACSSRWEAQRGDGRDEAHSGRGVAQTVGKRTESSSGDGRMDPRGQAMPNWQAMPNRSRTAAPKSLCAKTDGAAGASPHDRGTAETGDYLGKETRPLSAEGALPRRGIGI